MRTKTAVKQSEIELQKIIVDYLNLNGHFAWRTNAGLFFTTYKGKERAIRIGKKGTADIIGILNGGQFLAIEAKIGYNKPTPEQKQFLEEVHSRGGVAFVAYNLDDVIKRLRILEI